MKFIHLGLGWTSSLEERGNLNTATPERSPREADGRDREMQHQADKGQGLPRGPADALISGF